MAQPFLPHPSLPLAFAALALALPSCTTPGSEGSAEFVNTPYISRTVGVGTAGYGEIEIEGQLDTDPSEFAKSKVKVNLGVIPGVEMAIGWQPFVSTRSGGSRSRGTGDVILGTKVQLSNADEDGLGSIVELEARLPSGSAGSSSRKGEMDTLMATSVGKAMGQFSLIGTYELALLGEAGTDSIETEHGAIVAASWRANEETRLFAEASTSYSPSDGSSVWYGGFGGGYKFWPNLELQGALQIGLNDDAEDFFLVVGFSSVIGRFADATD